MKLQAYAGGGSGLPDPLGRTLDEKQTVQDDKKLATARKFENDRRTSDK